MFHSMVVDLMDKVAYVVNSTPKYFYLLDAHFGMYRRYATGLSWPVYFATEVPDHPMVRSIVEKYHVQILTLPKEESDFLESRAAALKLLPSSIKYVLMAQEDFLLERPGPNVAEMEKIVAAMEEDSTLVSARLMPCPGPVLVDADGPCESWAYLDENHDTYMFTFQATLWKRAELQSFYEMLLHYIQTQVGSLYRKNSAEYNKYQVSQNPAEMVLGKKAYGVVLKDKKHVAYIRKGGWSNAVYLCPWPYRPTAIVKGVLGSWAHELITREGFTCVKDT